MNDTQSLKIIMSLIIFISFLLQLIKSKKLRDAIRNDLFPSAEMVVSMSREFGVPLTAQDFEGKLLCVLDSKVNGSSVGSTWGWQAPCRPHVGPMNITVWDHSLERWFTVNTFYEIFCQCHRRCKNYMHCLRKGKFGQSNHSVSFLNTQMISMPFSGKSLQVPVMV